MTNPPSGTVTFLFTDIQGSTRLLQQLGPDRYGQVLSDQRVILRAAFERHAGKEIDTQGDAFFASFPRATQAVAAVVEIQQALANNGWPKGVEVRVRMVPHTGEPLVAEEGYVGMDVHRAARIAHVGHGGQVLLSVTAAELVRGELPEGIELVDLGAFRLKDIERGERIHQLAISGLESDYSPLKARQVKPPAEIARRKPAPCQHFWAMLCQKTPANSRSSSPASGSLSSWTIFWKRRSLVRAGWSSFPAGQAGARRR